jgi:hypothetical protein
MINYDYLLIILNCKKYRAKANIQKDTWLKHIPSNIKYYHVIGDKEKCNENDILVDDTNSIIYTNTLDDYNSLPSKVITALKGIYSTFNFKHIFKTDDDQDLISKTFFTDMIKVLESSNYHYGGLCLTVKDHISTYYTVHDCLPRDLLLKGTTYANGRFYLLSKLAVSDLIYKKKDIEKHIIEDHAIGLYLDNKYKEPNSLLNFNNNLYFKDIHPLNM